MAGIIAFLVVTILMCSTASATWILKRYNLNVAGKSCPVPKHTEKQQIPRSHGFRDPEVVVGRNPTSRLRIHALISRR